MERKRKFEMADAIDIPPPWTPERIAALRAMLAGRHPSALRVKWLSDKLYSAMLEIEELQSGALAKSRPISP